MPKLVYADRVISLDQAEVVLGRHRDCEVQVEDGAASRRHCRLIPVDGRWFLEDMDSANGTRLNGKRVKERIALAHEDSIGIGAARLQFQDPDSVVSAPAAIKRTKAATGLLANPSTLVGRNIGGCVVRELVTRTTLGAIFRAYQVSLERPVALKIIAPEIIEDHPEFAEEFVAAGRAAGALSHPGLVRLHECGRDEELGILWYTMELVEGESLAELVRRQGSLAPLEALVVIEKIAGALAAVHEAGQSHGDLHPGNVILLAGGQVKVREPGLALALAHGRGRVEAGDPAYRAPDGKPSSSADLYSLGCLLHALIAGAAPFAGDDADDLLKAHRESPIPSLKRPGVRGSEQLDKLLQGLMAKNPSWRYASVAEFLTELKPVRDRIAQAASEPAKPEPTPVAERVAARRSETRYRSLRGVVVALIILAIMVAGGWYALKGGKLPGLFEDPDVETGADPTPTVPPPVVGPAPVRPPPVVNPPPPRNPTQAKETWDLVRIAVESDRVSGNWGSAERQLTDYLATAPVEPQAGSARLLASQIQVEGGAWYQQRLAGLTGGSTPADLSSSLRALSRLRDVALAADRVDAEARYQEAQLRLAQHLALARREARRLLEAGNAAELPALAKRVGEELAGTPVAGMQRQFADLCTEAAGVVRLWKGSWMGTRTAFTGLSAEDSLAAGAALMVAGEIEAARTLLTGAPGLASGPLLRRRQAILGGEAALLAFDDPGDLQYVETTIGDIQFAGGAISGREGETVGMAFSVPVGGPVWEVSLEIEVADAPGKQASVVIACLNGEQQELVARINRDGMHLRIHTADGWADQDGARPGMTPMRLRLTCTAGRLQVVVNGEARFEIEKAAVPAGSRMVLDLAGARWQLNDIVVVGGG